MQSSSENTDNGVTQPDTIAQHYNQEKFIVKLSRKVDSLQCQFGVPASQRMNLDDDLICPEFQQFGKMLPLSIKRC